MHINMAVAQIQFKVLVFVLSTSSIDVFVACLPQSLVRVSLVLETYFTTVVLRREVILPFPTALEALLLTIFLSCLDLGQIFSLAVQHILGSCIEQAVWVLGLDGGWHHFKLIEKVAIQSLLLMLILGATSD